MRLSSFARRRWLALLLMLQYAASAQRSRPNAPASAGSLAAQAQAAREAGRLTESIALYRRALQLNPSQSEWWWYQGLNYSDTDRPADCANAFLRVTKLSPENGGAFAFLGLCEFKSAQYPAALTHLIQAKRIGLLPGSELDRLAQYHYAMTLNKLGQFEAAAAPLAEIARVAIDTPLLPEAAGINALRLPRTPLELTHDQLPTVRLAGQAALLAWTRKTADALPLAEQLVHENPSLPNAHYLLGWLLLLSHDPRAMDEFQQELKISPDHVQARLQIAYEQLQQGNAAFAVAPAREAVERAPASPAARYIYGRTLLETGAVPQAVEQLEAAVHESPSFAEAHFSLASAYQKAGRKLDAERARRTFSALEKQKASGSEFQVQPVAQ